MKQILAADVQQFGLQLAFQTAQLGFGLGALVALAHDALISLGLFSLCGRQVSLIVITAVLTIIGIVLVIIILPIIALLGIFSGGIDLGLDDINSMVQEQQQVGEATLVAIEEAMLDEGYSQLRVEEAQAVYLLALFDKSDEENFVERLVGCFEEEQTDAELISAVNAEFGTAITHSEFTEALQEVREK